MTDGPAGSRASGTATGRSTERERTTGPSAKRGTATARGSKRGTATTLSYSLTLGIAVILSTGLLIAGGTFIEDQRENTIQSEMEIVGQQVASGLVRGDQLAQTTSGTSVIRIEQRLPDQVAGSNYEITVSTSGDSTLILNSDASNVTVEVDVAVSTDLAETTVDGGDLLIVYDDTNDELEIKNG